MRRYEMTSYSLVQAAEMARVSKATIWRLVKRGIVSASRAEDGSFRIEASEFERYLSSMGLSQSFGVYGSLSLRAVSAPPNRRCPMILSAIAEKLKRRSKDDFKGRHFEAALILQAVSWYLRYPLSYRDIEELFLERGLEVDHSTLNRWVLAYAPLIEKRLRAFRKPHCGSIR